MDDLVSNAQSLSDQAAGYEECSRQFSVNTGRLSAGNLGFHCSTIFGGFDHFSGKAIIRPRGLFPSKGLRESAGLVHGPTDGPTPAPDGRDPSPDLLRRPPSPLGEGYLLRVCVRI